MDSYNSKLLHYLSTGFDQDMLDRIAELAAALTPISEIAALLDLNEDMLRLAINDKSSLVRKVYFKAKAETALFCPFSVVSISVPQSLLSRQ